MLAYLRSLTAPRIVLWCYLIWYLVVLQRYFDGSPALWLNSLGISAIIGLALYLSTAYAGASRVALGRWQVFRLFVMPFCVSSFAALIKGRGFVLVFHPDLSGNLLGAGSVAGFVALVGVAKRLGPARAAAAELALSSLRAPPAPPRHSPTGS